MGDQKKEEYCAEEMKETMEGNLNATNAWKPTSTHQMKETMETKKKEYCAEYCPDRRHLVADEGNHGSQPQRNQRCGEGQRYAL